ncbi:aa9e6c8d-fb96-4b44-9dfd-b9c2fdf78a1d [Sclerotinia trifoliorum]|uniref:Aa9e6c8d-fb96-4b44-9dfd-b9c2fdf78a1d n=1 Tax=Sclerotinia trifoliorum TaxID=28548 RepID=A0A8H2VMJ5_9HELO|nr:aa9e6c8d-fb96-4b44-9dfd-b9c2fdf78a1d [Sclerotinia trifoliorum]
MASHILRNTRLYTRQLNEQEMDILAAWLETLDPVQPGEEAAEVTVVLHYSLRRNDRVNAGSASAKLPQETSSFGSLAHHSKSRIVAQNEFNNNLGAYPKTTRSEGNNSPDWKPNSRQIKSFRPPPILIPGMSNFSQVKLYDNVDSIDERISPEIIRVQTSGETPITAIRTHCPPTVLSDHVTNNDFQNIPISSSPPLRQYEKQDTRVANWVRNTSSNSSYLGHQSQNSSKNVPNGPLLPLKPHDSANDPAILALMTAVVEEKRVEEARTSPRLIGSSERATYASSYSSTSSREPRLPANGRPRGYPYLKSDLHRDTGRLGIYQSDISPAYSQN